MANKELKQAPEELNFVAYVTAEIARDNYDRSVTLFMEGLERLIVSHTSINSEEFEHHVAAPLKALISYKLGQYSPAVASKEPAPLICSFCGKGEAKVTQLIAGPAVFICDGCVSICNQILAVGPDMEEGQRFPK